MLLSVFMNPFKGAYYSFPWLPSDSFCCCYPAFYCPSPSFFHSSPTRHWCERRQEWHSSKARLFGGWKWLHASDRHEVPAQPRGRGPCRRKALGQRDPFQRWCGFPCTAVCERGGSPATRQSRAGGCLHCWTFFPFMDVSAWKSLVFHGWFVWLSITLVCNPPRQWEEMACVSECRYR